MSPEKFVSELAKQGITLNEKQKSQFHTYYKLLVEWNEKVNLTALTDVNDVYLKHFYDSISPSFYFDFENDLSVCDIGAGAGFPSIPLKICFPELHVTIVDSLKKRINFLEHLIKELGLENVQLFHSRAEEFGQNKQYRESFDIVTARAVARLSVLSELCLPLCKTNGLFIALKGADFDSELIAAQKAITTLGGKVKQTESFKLPVEHSDRSIIFIKKMKRTPKHFPRKPGTPNRKPL